MAKDNAAEPKDQYLLSSLNDALKLLDVLSHYDQLTLAELTRVSGFDKARIFRMMHTFEMNGIVEKDEKACYHLGMRLLRYGGIVAAKQDIVKTAEPLMKNFSMKASVASHIGQLSGERVVTTHIENPPDDIRVTARVGMSAPAYSTAMGRVILAHLPEIELAGICAQMQIRHYRNSPIEKLKDLYPMLDRVKELGYASDVDERYEGFGSLAVPVFNHTGTCVAAVGIVTLAQSINAHEGEYIAQLKKLGDDLSKELGYTGRTNCAL